MRKRPNIFSIEIPIKDKFYQGQDLKEKIHFPEFQASYGSKAALALVVFSLPSKAKVE
jgi:hypothetical protein